MYSSGDTLLIEVVGVFIPAILVTIFTILYSNQIRSRYGKVMKRLYRSSFKGVDTERKRIAGELHDELGAHWVLMSQHFNQLKSELKDEQLNKFLQMETDYQLFKDKTHQIVEFMYPKGLSNPDWVSSFESLALQMSMGEIRVSFESHADRYPSENFLHHSYWAIQEIITNAIKHAHVSRIQISAIDEEKAFNMMVVYRATPEAMAWINNKSSSKKGYGTAIIEDRIRIIGAKQIIKAQDKVVTHTISIPYESPNS
jgi:signal transduction histidine kinase